MPKRCLRDVFEGPYWCTRGASNAPHGGLGGACLRGAPCLRGVVEASQQSVRFCSTGAFEMASESNLRGALGVLLRILRDALDDAETCLAGASEVP